VGFIKNIKISYTESKICQKYISWETQVNRKNMGDINIELKEIMLDVDWVELDRTGAG
jgi:hypothetical protein